MDKLKKLLEKAPILIPLLLVQAYGSSADLMAPILKSMQEYFPTASLTLVQMTLTLPSAVSIPVQLLTVPLAQWFTKKDMMMIAMVLLAIGGLIPFFCHASIMWVLISSVVLGLGQGLFTPSINAMASELFDGNMRATFLGIKGGTTAFIRSFMTIAVGFFGAALWSRSYAIFFFLVPLIIWFYIATPKGEKSAALVGKGVGLKGILGVVTPAFIIITILCSFASCFQIAFLTNISGFLADSAIGGTVSAGVATSTQTMSKFVMGLILGFLLKAFKRYTLPIGYGMCAAGYFIISRATGFSGVQVGGIIFGLGLGIQMSAGLYYLTETVDKKYLSQAMGLYFPFISFFISISPVIVNTMSKVFFSEVNAANNFMSGCIGYATLAVVMFLYQHFCCKDSMIGKISGI